MVLGDACACRIWYNMHATLCTCCHDKSQSSTDDLAQLATWVVVRAIWQAHTGTNAGAHLMIWTKPLKGVLSLTGTLNDLKSKELIRPGNWREAAMPVPSMPGMYNIRGRCATWRSGGNPGNLGMMKVGSAPTPHHQQCLLYAAVALG